MKDQRYHDLGDQEANRYHARGHFWFGLTWRDWKNTWYERYRVYANVQVYSRMTAAYARATR